MACLAMAVGAVVSCSVPGNPGGAAPTFPLGEYVNVTESEWSVLMLLREDHTVRIELASWEAGEWEGRHEEVHEGSWSCRGDSLTAEFEAGTLEFEYDPELSFGEFAGVGSAPGFRRISGSFAAEWFVRSLYEKRRIDELQR